MNLIGTNHQINMASDRSISSNNLFKSHLNTKSFDMFLTLQQLCEARLFCFSDCCKSDANVCVCVCVCVRVCVCVYVYFFPL